MSRKLGKISYKRYEEYDKIKNVIHSCEKQKHCRKKIFSTKKFDETERSRAFTSKKRVQSAMNHERVK